MEKFSFFKSLFEKVKARRLVNLDLLLLLAVLLVLFWPYFSKIVWPHNDTGYSFQYFYFFYNDLFFHGEIPRWMPFGLFGIPGDFFQIVDLSPPAYFMALTGCLFRIGNVLLLFKLSVFLELLMLLAGTWLLSRELYERRASAIFVTLAVLASTVWHSNIYFNFRIYTLLPFMFFFLLRAVRRREFSALCLAGLTFFISLLGNLPYYSVLYFYILLLFVLILLIGERPDLRTLCVFSWKNAAGLAALVFVGVTIVYFFAHALDGLAILTPGRDPKSGGVSLETFLTYGGDIGFRKFLGLFYAGPTQNPAPDRILDNTLYAGLLPLVFFLYSFRAVRKTAFVAIGAVALFLITFSLGDATFVARASFYLLPGIRMFRHIGLVGDMMKLFIPLLAGFGLDRFLTDLTERNSGAVKKPHPVPGIIFCGISVLILALFIDFKVNPQGTLFPRIWPAHHNFALILLALAILVLAGAAKKSPKAAGTLAILFLALDLFFYQHLVAAAAPRHADAPAGVAFVNPYLFQPARSDTPVVDQRSFDASKIVVSSSVSTLAYGFIQTDPCGVQYPGITFRTEYLTQGTNRLIRARGGNPPTTLPFQDASFMKAAGCASPKLTLNSNVIFADTPEQAEALVRQTPDINQPAILRLAPSEARISSTGVPDLTPPGSLNVLSFSANRLTVEADIAKPGGTWLIYADSFHPDWGATVDGRRLPVAEANLAFKAVKLEAGKHIVRFSFGGGLTRFASFCAIIFGALFTAAILFAFIRILFPPARFFSKVEGSIGRNSKP